MTIDPYAAMKAAQREGWGLFAPIAPFTTPAAAALVAWAGVMPGQKVLDVACGTGVVAITAAELGAEVCGLDLSPALLAEASANGSLCTRPPQFREGDVEALPYADASFDVVLSQYGHMFAPRPQLAIAEMLRVLKPGGRIAFSTWPPELVMGRLFALIGSWLPGPPGAAAPEAWGDIANIRERLGSAVRELEFQRDEIFMSALSPRHFRAGMERTAAPFIKLAQALAGQPERLAIFRAEAEAIIASYLQGNRVRQGYLMTRGLRAH